MAKAKKIKAAGYLRRSDKGQEASIKDQRTTIIEYAATHDITIVRWYVDDGISGDSTKKRKAFLEMRDDADSGEFAAVLCWDQSRFGRFDSLEAGHWIYPFREAGVVLITVMDGAIDWNDFTGRMMYAMQQEGKNQWLKDHSAAVLRGQIEAAKTGSWIGYIPYGYRLEGPKKGRRLVLGDVAKVQVVERIFHEYVEEGRSLSDIARRLEADKAPSSRGGPWRFDAVKCILENPVYTGTFRFNTSSRSKYHTYTGGAVVKGGRTGRKPPSDWIVRRDNHPAIVDQRTYDRAQALVAKGKGRTQYTPETNPYLLSGVLRCGHCGAVLHGDRKGADLGYLCTGARKGKCPGMSLRESEVLDMLVAHIEAEYLPAADQHRLAAKAAKGKLTEKDLPAAFNKLRTMLVGKPKRQDNPARIARQIAQLDAQRAKVQRNLAYVDPKYIAGLQAELDAMEETRADLLREAKQQPTEADINKTVLAVLEKLFWLGTLEPDRIKPVLRELDHITLYAKKTGKGVRSRYQLLRGEVHLRVGVNTSKENLHRLV